MKTRNELPFFKKGTRNTEASWWHVTPTGNYMADRGTGRQYARAFLPMMLTNAGPATLCWIIDAMAQASGATKSYRHVDDIALGFLAEIGDLLQRSISSVAVARVAIDNPASPLAAEFKSRVDDGTILGVAA